MTLGIFTYDLYPIEGGMGNHIYKIYYQNLSKEYPIIFFSPCKNDLDNHFSFANWTKKFGKNISFSLLFNMRVRKSIRKHKLHKIHMHCGPGGIFLLRKIRKTKVVAIFHHTYWQQKEYIEKQRWKRIFCIFERVTLKKVDKIVCVSKDTKDVIVEQYKIPNEKVIVIPNVVDKKEYFPIEGIEKIPNSLLYVGRLDERKGIKFLVKTYSLLAKSSPHIKLYIIGKGPYTSYIQDEKEKNQLINISLLGFVPQKDLNEWYNKASCFICPSIFEGFGITVIEAMAAGTPVIATNVSGIRTILNDGYNGYLVDYNDTSNLIQKIQQVLSQNNEIIIKNALKDVQMKYELDSILNQIIESSIL